MSEKKVLCPWCGKEMIITEQQDIFHGKHARYHCLSCEAYAPIGYDEESAYLAATRRPPNLPLTKEQIMGMDDNDAVWLVFDWKDVSVYLAAHLKEAVNVGFVLFAGHNPTWYAYSPTSAEIDAARKERQE